jgi:hypothetical protein
VLKKSPRRPHAKAQVLGESYGAAVYGWFRGSEFSRPA